MPRILVADDNSNIQKMVTLALKDIGIDVVAVPNGEAAVRKLTDVNLDLVLADIFMPVRSGYEVCEYIKQDPRYSHLPVVLLVGAFDPLDEREAQRVGADGILKKPFVPPDPLINLVKNLLAKSAAQRLVPVAVPAAAAVAAPIETQAALPPKTVAENFPSPAAEFSDAPFEELGPAVATLDFSDHENPVAFSNLLDAPAVDDSDLVVTAHRDPSLGEPVWSHPPAVEAETETGNEETSDEEALQEHSWGSHGTALPLAAESTALPAIAQEAERLGEIEDGGDAESQAPTQAAQEVEASVGTADASRVELQAGSNDHQDSLEVASIAAIEIDAGEAALTQDSPLSDFEQSFLRQTKVSEEFSEPQHIGFAPEPTQPVHPAEPAEVSFTPETYELSDESPVAEPRETTVHEIELGEAQTPNFAEHSQNAEPIAGGELAHGETDPKPTGFHAWMATVASIFSPVEAPLTHSAADAEASEAEPLSAPQVASHVAPEHSQGEEHPEGAERSHGNGQTEHVEQFAQALPPVEWPPAFEPKTSELSSFGDEAVTAFHEISHGSARADGPGQVTNGATVADSQPAVAALEMPTPMPDSALPGSRIQSPEMIEAMVTRIVERMQPKVFDVVTREILRPLVEALVRREMDKR